MNKKGGHVDWVISMGIFLIYIFALFILLRPGIKPVYKPVNLLDILQDGFEKDVVWTVKKIPLFIRSCSAIGNPQNPANDIVLDIGGWSFSRAIDGKENQVGSVSGGSFTFSCYESIPKVIYLYFYSSGSVISPPQFDDEPCVDIEKCNAELGVVEDIKGINSAWLDEIKSRGEEYYDKIKTQDWWIPQDKEFAIFKDEFNNGRVKVIGKEAPAEANVFVRRVDYQVVNENGETDSVAIYLQIW